MEFHYLLKKNYLYKMSFGDFVYQWRKDRGITLRNLASELEMSPGYLCDIEKGNRSTPTSLLPIMKERFEISDEDATAFYDWAYLTKGALAPDMVDYIKQNPSVLKTIRESMENASTPDLKRPVSPRQKTQGTEKDL